MKKQKRKGSRSIYTTALLLTAAVALLLGSAVGGSRAALTYFSENYSAQVNLSHIGVTLTENGADISSRDYSGRDDVWEESTGALLTGMAQETGGQIQIGRAYTEKLAVRNSGSIDEYVRVMVYRYWTDENGQKTEVLSPDQIHLNLQADGTDSGWVVDEEASTAERTILYYTKVLPVGETTPALSDTLTIDASLASCVTETKTTTTDGYTVITTTFDYDGMQFVLEAEVDAVQTHNAEAAIKSAWGVDVKQGADGSLALQ